MVNLVTASLAYKATSFRPYFAQCAYCDALTSGVLLR
jgi:hypothetical protein